MKPWLKAAAWALLVLAGLLAAGVALVASFDWNRAKPWIEPRVAEATQRSFAIRGDLALHWYNPGTESGWRGWVPWPRLHAQDIVLGNTDWSRSGAPMAAVGGFTVSINPLSLLARTIDITELTLEQPALSLERAADGRANWSFDKRDDDKAAASAWQVTLKRLALRQGTVALDDALQKMDFKAQIDSLPPEGSQPYGIGWKLQGSYRGAALRGSGKAGAVLALRESSAPYPLQASVQAGRTHATVEGTLTQPAALAALDLRLKLAGDSMADLYKLTGITLPKTPPYSTEGRLVGHLEKGNARWLYEGFSGKVGGSDIAGTLEYMSRPERPLLRGEVRSRLLRFEDLAPLIGAGPKARQAAPEPVRAQPADKVLPVIAFDTQSWGSIDADVKFSGQKIVRDKDLPIDTLVTQLRLQDRVLSLTPLNFGVAGGNLVSNLKFDARSGTILADARLSARRLRLKQILPALESMRGSFGELNGEAALTGRGNSVAAMLGSANGELKLLVNQGTLSKFLLEAAGLNIGSVVVTQLFGDRQVQLNCLASDFQLSNGVMQTRAFVLDTDQSAIHVQGQIDLAREQLALEIQPRNKALRVLSLRAPLYVRGSFKKPEVGIDKGTIALKLGAAIAMGVAAPVSALLPLSSLGTEEQQDDCKPLLEMAREKPVAPRPGARRR